MAIPSVREPETAHPPSGIADLEHAAFEAVISDDYSTSESGIVPLSARKPLWHFYGLILTLNSGVGFVFVGFVLFAAGYTFVQSMLIIAAGTGIYWVYAIFAAYLGASTGRTHTLLTRSILGKSGSWLASGLVVIVFSGWVGFNANLAAQLWSGLYGWGGVLTIGIVVAGLGIANNAFGFTGISAWARYVVCPFLILWITYMFLKGLIDNGGTLFALHPKDTTPLGVLPAIGFVTGYVIWGTEPDVWRYSQPRISWPMQVLGFALFIPGFALQVTAGWIIGALAHQQSFGPAMHFTANYSLFGALWLAFILVLITQVALNDGNYYSAINAVQNIAGGAKNWKRLYSCIICCAGGLLGAWIVPDVLTNGFFKLASFAAIGVPSATVIMATDYFLVPRLFGLRRPMDTVPAWKDVRVFNWPGFVALITSVVFGAYASGLFSFFGESSSTNWGLPAMEAWLLGAALYLAGVWIATLTSSSPGRILAFPEAK